MTQVVVQGFSKTNRWLLYTSVFLTPAQAWLGTTNSIPIGQIGFLAYNWYNQIVWYHAIRQKQLHALSLLPSHFNLIYALTYLGGVTHNNGPVVAAILGLGTVGLVILNEVAAWTSWATNQPEGFGIYKFFFFGWRTLTPSWHTFMLLWQLSDSFIHVGTIVSAIAIPYFCAQKLIKLPSPSNLTEWILWALGGLAVALFLIWPLILWTELIISHNHIESGTDNIAVYLFIVQAAMMFIPDCLTRFLVKLHSSAKIQAIRFIRLLTQRTSNKDVELADCTPTEDTSSANSIKTPSPLKSIQPENA